MLQIGNCNLDINLCKIDSPQVGNPIRARGVARLFKMRGQQGGLRGEQGGADQWDSKWRLSIDLCSLHTVQSVISFGGERGGRVLQGARGAGQSFSVPGGAVAPCPPPPLATPVIRAPAEWTIPKCCPEI